MVSTCVLAETETAVVFERKKAAVSPAALGTVAGVQFPFVFQSPVPGLASHVALPAMAGPPESRSSAPRAGSARRLSLRVNAAPWRLVANGPSRSAPVRAVVRVNVVAFIGGKGV